MKQTNSEIIAVFDFDGTLTYHDSLVSFLNFQFGALKTSYKLITLFPQFARYLLGNINRQQMKEDILTSFLKNASYKEVAEQGEQFATTILNQLIRPEGLKKIEWHKKQKHQCILISANLDLYLDPWGKSMGFTHVISSNCAVTNGVLSGKLEGKNCWGQEKVRRLEKTVGPLDQYRIFVYGDSRGDKELLEIADYAFFQTLQ